MQNNCAVKGDCSHSCAHIFSLAAAFGSTILLLYDYSVIFLLFLCKAIVFPSSFFYVFLIIFICFFLLYRLLLYFTDIALCYSPFFAGCKFMHRRFAPFPSVVCLSRVDGEGVALSSLFVGSGRRAAGKKAPCAASKRSVARIHSFGRDP